MTHQLINYALVVLGLPEYSPEASRRRGILYAVLSSTTTESYPIPLHRQHGIANSVYLALQSRKTNNMKATSEEGSRAKGTLLLCRPVLGGTLLPPGLLGSIRGGRLGFLRFRTGNLKTFNVSLDLRETRGGTKQTNLLVFLLLLSLLLGLLLLLLFLRLRLLRRLAWLRGGLLRLARLLFCLLDHLDPGIKARYTVSSASNHPRPKDHGPGRE